MKSNTATTQADFAWFVESQSGALLRLAYAMTGQSEAAEDLVQDTLIAVFRHWQRVASARSRDAYVRRMLTNRYLSTARRQRFEERSLDDSQADRSAGPATVEDHDALWRALSQISPRQQAVLVLRYYEDLDDEQISTILRCRRATVRSLASRALAALRSNQHLQASTSAETRSEDR